MNSSVPFTDLISIIHGLLAQTYRENRTLLEYKTPFQLLISVILSAQTTDNQVNAVTPGLFMRFPTPGSLANGSLAEIEELIHATGFFKMKARHIKATAQKLVEAFGGKVPGTMDELLTLKGVGRKSANVVLAHCFGKPAVIVDTHYMRVTKRLGLTAETEPGLIEKDLAQKIPEKLQTDLSMYLNYLGRDWCKARKPDCQACPLNELCPSAGTYL